MSVVARGTKNAFRNSIRTVSIVAILALSIALAMVMLLSMKAVEAKTDDVKSSVGNTITVTPAGARGFQGGGTPLTTDDVAKVNSTKHVVSATGSIQDRLRTEGSTGGGGPFGNSNSNAVTNLTSPITPGTLGQQNNGGVAAGGQGGTQQAPTNFVLPITVTGTTDPTSTRVSDVSSFTLTAGTTIDGTSSDNVALVGKDLATKNNLTVGSTFTAYGQTITVKGVYDTGNTFTNAGVIMPLATLQTLSGQSGVTSIDVKVDSVDNLDATVTALQTKLGTTADVVSDATSTADTVASLDNIRTIALYSLIGALVAGAAIILLSMVMIVRERRREIGVLKAIGSSNSKISFQFVTEALTLTLMAAVVGILLGVVLSNPVLNVLVSSESSTSTVATAGFTPGGGGQGAQANGNGNAQRGNFQPGQGGPPRINFGNVGQGVTNFGDTLSNVKTAVGFDILLYGLLAAVFVAMLGSALPAWLIAKVRPAEVMRTE
jgi:putative ABC transport system permease protein